MSAMRLLLFLLCGVSLLGCNRAGPHFRDVAPTRVSVAGSTFDVRVKPRLAEAMRINAEYAPRLGPIEARAALAMQAVSGCVVVQVLGDAALMTGVLDCGDGSLPLVAGRAYDCDLVEDYTITGLETQFRDFDCRAVPFAF